MEIGSAITPLESNCSDSDNYQVQTSTPELSLPLLPCRLTGQQAGAIINSFFDQTPGLAENPELLPPTIFEILENLPMADTYLRKYLFNNTFLQVASIDNPLAVKETKAIIPFLVVLVVRYAVTQALKYAVKRAIKTELINLSY